MFGGYPGGEKPPPGRLRFACPASAACSSLNSVGLCERPVTGERKEAFGSRVDAEGTYAVTVYWGDVSGVTVVPEGVNSRCTLEVRPYSTNYLRLCESF